MNLPSPLYRIALAAALLLPVPAHAGDEKRPIAVIENELVADDPDVRAKAAAELTGRFPDGAVAIPMLVDLLDDEDPVVFAAAVQAIHAMNVAGTPTLTSFCSDEANWKGKARFGEALPILLSLEAPRVIDCLGDDLDSKGGAQGAMVLAALVPAGSERTGMMSLAEVVRGTTGATRTQAAAALAALGAEALVGRPVVLPQNDASIAAARAVIALLKSPADGRAWAGARLLARLRYCDPEFVAALNDALVSVKTSIPLRFGTAPFYAPASCCRALGAIGAPAGSATPNLLKVAAKAAETTTTAKDHEFIAAAERDLAEAVRALIRIGRESDLRSALAAKPTSARVFAAAVAAEGRAADAVLPVLLPESKEYHDSVLPAIAALGGSAASALPTLQTQLRESEGPSEALAYVDVILAVSPKDEEVLTFLVDAMSQPELPEWDRETAWEVLARRAPPTPSVVALLVAAVSPKAAAPPDRSWDLVIERLGRCGAAAKGAVPDLVRLCGSADKSYADPERRRFFDDGRRPLATALGEIGPDAAPAVPLLEAWKAKGDGSIRVPAAQALRRIRAKR